jgi:hypothetical protein
LTESKKNWLVRILGYIFVVVFSLLNAIAFIVAKVSECLHSITKAAAKWAGRLTESRDYESNEGMLRIKFIGFDGEHEVYANNIGIGNRDESLLDGFTKMFENAFGFFKGLFKK